MISAEMKQVIRVVTSTAVASWRENGRDDDETIRVLAIKLAAKVVAEKVDDVWDQESYMAEINRGIDRALKQKLAFP